MRTGLGMDTGGTYTDAVVMDLDAGRVLCKAKSPTTREDLSIGIRGALSALDRELLDGVGVVSLSSTLATNSIVEGKGARVALVSIGMDYDNSLRVDHAVTVAGGHDVYGNQVAPLDEDAVRSFLESVRGKVDGVAVTGYFAIRNPAHENRVRELADEVLGVPAVCGHDLSSSLGFNERAATCIMNTRLIPVIRDLMESVEKVLKEFGIRAPLMMVRGDGSMMGRAEIRNRPVETILSGPASSLIGAMVLTGRRDAVVMDIGGTTTDIGILRDGKPRLEPEGAVIGGIRTRVLAAEITTSGIGGDSRMIVINGKLRTTPLRVMPICRACAEWPELRDALARMPRIRPIRYAVRDQDSFVMDSEFFRTLRHPPASMDISEDDRALLDILEGTPKTLRDAAVRGGRLSFTESAVELERLGYVQRIGFTPTDMLHARGEMDSFDSDAARTVAAYLADGMGMPLDAFLDHCRAAVRARLCTELVKRIMYEDTGIEDLGTAGGALVSMAVSGNPPKGLGCSLRVNMPVIGIGAPVEAYIPQVGETLGTEVLIHPDSDVGNAVGAVCSSVSDSISILIRPVNVLDGRDFTSFSKLGRGQHPSLEDAVESTVAAARAELERSLLASGAEGIEFSVDRTDRTMDVGAEKPAITEVSITVTAAGRPGLLGRRPLPEFPYMKLLIRWGPFRGACNSPPEPATRCA
ncbi:MAG: hydantoinase/oxoprolinase family protein [Thermoplasmata archaeon]|nr:hydantoinase/oxoprolinase family protein [Thermoplasmata archaeon]